MLKNIKIQNSYYDSATLMLLTNKFKEKLNLSSEEVAIMMATEMNKRIMKNANLLNEDGQKANSGDMLIAIKTDLEEEEILSMLKEIINKKNNTSKNKMKNIETVEEAVEEYSDYNFAVVSIPGVYAYREVKKLLNSNKHILLFSDNVSLEDEIKLKDLAISKNLLMMGPDCGTAIINGVGLGFSNKVRKGNIGIVAASGTGLQEVATLISNNGGGISQAFGTGGRDIQEIVGGKMMLHTLDYLINDDFTDTIVIVSKPPAKSVLDKIKEKLKNVNKKIVAVFLGAEKNIFLGTNIQYASSLEEAAYMALGLENKREIVNLELEKGSKYIRAIYCGGTLAYESLLALENKNMNVYSNLSKNVDKKLYSKSLSQKHTVLDMGDDEFTVGKPHPMIDPSLRSERFLKEGLDKETAVIITDIELGYGSNDDATQLLVQDIKKVRKNRPKLPIIVVLCGSKLDYQGYEEQKRLLLNENVIVTTSNYEAISIAINSIEKGGEV